MSSWRQLTCTLTGMKIVYKTYVCVFCTLRVSRSSAGAMSLIHVLASTKMDPLQDPHLRIHVSASLCLRLLCKIHVFGFMSQHPRVSQDPLQDPCLQIHISTATCISGSSTRSTSSGSSLTIFVSHGFWARSMSPDSCLSIFISQDPQQDPCLRIHVSDSCLSIRQYGSSARSMSPESCLSIFVSQDSLQDPCFRIHVSASTNMGPLQDPRLRIHVSASLYLRLLCKIHVSGFMSQHPYVSQDPLQDPCLRIHISTATCISGSSTRSTSSGSSLSIFVSHGFCARSMSPDSCLSILISQDPQQDPCLRIHVSDSCLSIRQYGSSARSMSPDSCLSIFVSQDSLQDPCLRIPVSASTNMGPLQDPRLRIHVSASLYLRFLCKIHVSGFMSQHPYVSQDPLQDPCLRIHISASISISGSSARSMSPSHVSPSLYLRVLCKIHVSGFMSQHLFISGSSARSMSPDPCVRFVS